MYDYMAALHRQFFRGTDFTELEEDIEQTRQEVRDCLSKEERRKLLRLVDLQNLLREGRRPEDQTLDCYTVTAENMFTDPMDQILFPVA